MSTEYAKQRERERKVIRNKIISQEIRTAAFAVINAFATHFPNKSGAAILVFLKKAILKKSGHRAQFFFFSQTEKQN